MEKEIFSIFFIRMILLFHSYFYMKCIYDIHIYSYNNQNFFIFFKFYISSLSCEQNMNRKSKKITNNKIHMKLINKNLHKYLFI